LEDFADWERVVENVRRKERDGGATRGSGGMTAAVLQGGRFLFRRSRNMDCELVGGLEIQCVSQLG
jgi:hypothetical protein